jgi:S-disulfanyl-L-cysteine oxidoreductase SoxD
MLNRLHKEFRDMRGGRMLTVMGRDLATVTLILLLGTGLAHGWPWSRDMVKQPSVKPQTAPRVPPTESVPIQGKEPLMDRIEAGKKLHNPVTSTAVSIENGKRLFNTYCTPCHGPGARGDGPVARKFVPPPDLTLEVFRKRPDGFIYETIRSGGPLMPAQGEALSSKDRWDVVNYLRSLQQKGVTEVR